MVLRAVAYAWLLCRLGVGRERYYFGCALGASGLCFAQQVRLLGYAALYLIDNLELSCPGSARQCFVPTHRENSVMQLAWPVGR